MSGPVVDAFDPLAMIRVLNKRGVRFVVIGGIAADVQAAMWMTTDLDVSYGGGDYTRLARTHPLVGL